MNDTTQYDSKATVARGSRERSAHGVIVCRYNFASKLLFSSEKCQLSL